MYSDDFFSAAGGFPPWKQLQTKWVVKGQPLGQKMATVEGGNCGGRREQKERERRQNNRINSVKNRRKSIDERFMIDFFHLSTSFD